LKKKYSGGYSRTPIKRGREWNGWRREGVDNGNGGEKKIRERKNKGRRARKEGTEKDERKRGREKKEKFGAPVLKTWRRPCLDHS
jgi:hypothetical protein